MRAVALRERRICDAASPDLNIKRLGLAFAPLLPDVVGGFTPHLTHKLVGGPALVRAHVSFEWLEDGHFLIQRMGDAARWIVGRDDTSKLYGVLYADSRGVSRLYEMSLSNGVWKIWRKARGFHQRFTGRFSRDGRTVKASWKKSVDGTRWQHDFDVTYTKTKLE